MTKRRAFIKLSLASSAGILSAPVVFADLLPKGVSLLAQQDPYQLFSKDQGMVLLNDRPWNMEAKAHLLDDKVTPASNMFIRNNGLVPTQIDTSQWTLTIDGESVSSSKTYTLAELKSKFPKYTYQLTLECGGNGRSEFNPPAKGNQWTIGAVSCAIWGGLRISDLLEDVGLKSNAVYLGYYGADTHLSGDASKVPISRGVPIRKALQP
ncbi:MAG: molybdopterin-dependent oxidoreductase, partial [Bacteroidota bacterium]